MTSGNLIPTAVLKRKAVVYVRQSTQAQVQLNLESQRRQYELVDVARRWGFRKVEVIDEDLGRTASGAVERPGFERLVDDLCTGQVGAVLCLEASRLSRNGPDWHRLLELCGEVDARVIDLDGIYDPGLPNDRLLLGMKGSISEFELGVLRARMYEAARAKAQRGELRISVPFGYVWHRDYGLGFDPDMRLQETIRLIFARFRELGSARQVLISMIDDGVHFPRPSDGKKMVSFDWVPIRYRNVISILKNPFYAGAYVYGKSEKRTEIVDGRVRKSYGHYKPASEWAVVLNDHHEGYIGWNEYERNQELPRGQRLWQSRRRQVGPRRSRAAPGSHLLWSMRAKTGCHVCRTRPRLSGISLRARQPHDGTGAMHVVQRLSHRRGGDPRSAGGGCADGDRSGVGG